MEADRRRLHWIIVSAYALIASAWIIVPDLMMDQWGRPGNPLGGMAWDSLFAFVSSAFLYLLLSGMGLERLAGLRKLGPLGLGLLALGRRGMGWLVLLYLLAVLAAMAMPDVLWVYLASPRIYAWLVVGWDSAFILGCAAVLKLCLNQLDDDCVLLQPRHGQALAYLFAVCGSLLVLVLRFQLRFQHHLMLLFLIPIGLSALLGGLGPGLLSIALIFSIVASLSLTSFSGVPAGPASQLLSLSLLVLIGVLFSVMGEVQLRARARLAMVLARRQAALESLRHSDERFRVLFSDSPVAMAISRMEDGALEEVNQAFLDLLQLTRERALGHTTLELGIWKDAADRSRLMEALRSEGEVRGVPVTLLRDDGSVLQGLLSFRLIHFDGEAHVHGVVLDVTERHRAQMALRESEARLAGMVSSAMDGIITLDADQRITLFNAAAERMFGRRAQDMLGQPLDCLLPPTMRAAHRQKVQRFGDGDAAPRHMGRLGKVQGMRAGGGIFDLEASIATQNVDGRRSYTVILRDISERERTQAEMTQRMQQLEALNDLNRAILAASDAEQIAQIGLRSLRRQVPFWGATAMLIDWESSCARVLAIERAPGASYDPGQRLSLVSYGMEDLERMKRGETCVVTDLGQIPRRALTLERLYQQGIQSYARIPLLAEGRLLGMLNLTSDATGAFDAAQLEVAQAYARHLAVSLQQSLLRQRVARLGRVYEVLSRINALVARCHEREELFDGICRVTVEVGTYRMAWVGVIDPETLNGTVVAFRGEDSDYLRQIRLSAKEDSPFRDRPACKAVRQREIVVCNDVQEDASLKGLAPHLISYGVRSVACLPVMLDGRACAVLALFAGDVGAFDRQEMGLLRELASDIGFALDHIQKEERLDYLAYYDSLTGLANRSLLGERLAQRMADSAQEGRRFALAVFDIENFKSINDVFGRNEGDQVLKLLTQRLLRHTQDASLLARIGADQFALVLPQAAGEDEAALGIEQMRRECLDSPLVLNGDELRLSAKFGLSMHPDDGSTAMGLLERAESAVKRAKAGKEQFLFYRQEMTDRAAAALEMGSRLRQALELQQFELHYQPKFAAQGHAIVGAEALLRWRCPGRGMVPPAQFVPMLEELGLISEVGDWVLRQAARDYQSWRAAGLPAPRIAVNVSPLQLRRSDFAQSLAAVLAMHPQHAGIDIEITESQIMADVDSSIAMLRQVRELGVSIALDDFGTGHSSLAYLARLPVQALKIDRSFVSRMLDEEEAMTLVGMIVSLAHSMGLETVAEGVETEPQARVLAELGCDTLQGFWLGRPMPGDAFAARLADDAALAGLNAGQ
ncbi:bifunctional diguanylate cyclase/phosphodiesterase [Chromobacterium violaceum]|uniref:bifunctional diguanylate cyclase/phosphodiesterase n=1 Tax=Chromobacterium violaceum TaxID=536 RepID=UPI001C8CC9BA|nr:EAL domain-containing protein [Chromobacterium violaceum]MBX9269235.1 EAL domain-containing protein [Chromobacterium violaceum]